MKRKPKPSIKEETFQIPCRIYGCHQRAKYRVGNLKGSPMVFFHVCEDCLASIVQSYCDMEERRLVKEHIEDVKNSINEDELIKEIETLGDSIEDMEPIETIVESLKEMEEIEKEAEYHQNKIFHMSYRELQAYAKEIDVNATGKHEELLARVAEHLGSVEDE